MITYELAHLASLGFADAGEMGVAETSKRPRSTYMHFLNHGCILDHF